MHNCAFCKNPLRPLTEWKGNDGRFYCSEFCADAGEIDLSIAAPPEMASTDRSAPMSDDHLKKGMQDRTRINTSEDYELRYWSEKFGVTQDQLKAAVNKVGNSVSAVEKELKAA